VLRSSFSRVGFEREAVRTGIRISQREQAHLAGPACDMTQPTHLLFDFFGTLVTYSESRTEQGYSRSHELLLSLGVDTPYSRFLEEWVRMFEVFEARARADLAEYSMDSVCIEFLKRTLLRAPDEPTVVAFRDVYLDEWNKGVCYIRGVDTLLGSLAEQFVLVLVTNTHHAELVHAHLRAMDVAHHFAGVTTSIEHGKRKPSASIFERALLDTGGDPRSSVYVGDSFEADYQGATGAGLRCLLIDPDRRHDVPEEDRVGSILEAGSRFAG
jgi:putative hydrolase of the HAD superfamily